MRKVITGIIILLTFILFTKEDIVLANQDIVKVNQPNQGLNLSNVKFVRTNLEKKSNPLVCVNDMEVHGDEVYKFVEKYYDGPIRIYRTNNANFTNQTRLSAFKNCSIINYSIGSLPVMWGYSNEEKEKKLKEFYEKEYNDLEVFFKTYKGIIVNSAGNEDSNTLNSSTIARYKKMNTENGLFYKNNKMFVVGQIERNELGLLVHHFAEGDYVDFVVANYGESIVDFKENFTGTSYSAPVATGVMATLLQAGVPADRIRYALVFEKQKHIYNGKEYKVLDVFGTLRNAHKHIQK